MMSRILFVDDEPFLLAALRRSLRSKRNEWDMHFVENGIDALALMDDTSFDAIVTDMRMPQMTGTQLVNEIVERGHDTVRVLLTGQSEQHAILPCIGLVHRFLSKPCEPKRLVRTLEQLLVARQNIDENVRPALTNLEFLPTQPAIEKAFTSELAKAEPEIETLGKLLSSDVGLSAKFVQVAQSRVVSSYAEKDRFAAMIESIGIDVVRMLQDEGRLFCSGLSTVEQFNLEEFNHRSIERIAVADVRSSTTALLQDVGELALACFPEFADHNCERATNYLLSLWTPELSVKEHVLAD